MTNKKSEIGEKIFKLLLKTKVSDIEYLLTRVANHRLTMLYMFTNMSVSCLHYYLDQIKKIRMEEEKETQPQH